MTQQERTDLIRAITELMQADVACEGLFDDEARLLMADVLKKMLQSSLV